jgi:hypothetical protein
MQRSANKRRRGRDEPEANEEDINEEGESQSGVGKGPRKAVTRRPGMHCTFRSLDSWRFLPFVPLVPFCSILLLGMHLFSSTSASLPRFPFFSSSWLPAFLGS